MSDGSVRCWGANSLGMLGDRATGDRATPIAIAGLEHALSVIVADHHACALIDGGTIRCWGVNMSGELGDGSTVDRSTPVSVSGITNATQVALGRHHSCALLQDHTMRCWGRNTNAQLGVLRSAPQVTPVIPAGAGVAEQIAAGASFTCLRRADHTVACWGLLPRTPFGIAADATEADADSSHALAGMTDAVDLAASDAGIAIARANGTLVAYEDNGDARPMPGEFTHASIVEFACGVQRDGRPFCVDGPSGEGSRPRTVGPTDRWLAGIADIQSGRNWGCALTESGELWCWGTDGRGASASGSFADVSVPQRIDVFGQPVSAVHEHSVTPVFGDTTFCRIVEGVELRCPIPNSDPVETQAPARISSVAIGNDHACMVLENHRVFCFGHNDHGQLGIRSGNPGATYDPGYDDLLASLDARTIDAGDDFSCATTADGHVACWGRNDLGQTGARPGRDQLEPVIVPNVANAEQVVVGDAHACARTHDGSVLCWGDNTAHQRGSTGRTPAAAAVTGVQDVLELSAGANFTCARRRDGTVVCWGSNTQGQRGLGSFDDVPLAPVTGLSDVTRLVSGMQSTCALRRDGTVWCWGGNDFAELGSSDEDDRATAAPVFGLTAVRDITAGGTDVCARMADDTYRCWAGHFDGLTPVPVEF
jgi:alpha-tubulin suppressor-like RCC1 family protein